MKKIDMTHGPIGRKTIRFALLLALTGMLQQVFNTIDTIIMGQFVGKEAMAAVGSNMPIISLIVTFFIGISLGANVVISQMMGRGNQEGIHRAVFTTLAFAIAAGLTMTALSEAAAGPLLSLLQVPDALMPLSLEYLRIFFLALPGILAYNFSAAIFRSEGDTKTPLLCLGSAGIIKVILSYSLVVFFHQGVAAVAISTMCATLLSSAMLVAILLRSTHVIRLELRTSLLDLYILREILRIGTPAGVQAAVFCLANIVIQSAINSLGADAMAGSAAAFNLEILVYIFINAFGQACTTFVGQNYGAGDMARCRRVGVITTTQNLALSILLGAPILYFAVPLLHLFTADVAVIGYAVTRVYFIILAEPLNLVIEMISAYLRGFGNSLAPALIAVVGICGFRVLYMWTLFPLRPDFDWLMTVYPLSWLITAVGLVILLFKTRKKYILG